MSQTSFHKSISILEYDDHPALRNSFLKTMFFQSMRHATTPLTTTLNMQMGTAVHSAVLTPGIFDAENGLGKNKTSYKQVKNEALGGDGILWGRDPWNKIIGMATALNDNSSFQKLIRGGLVEESFFWRDQRTGLNRKCRADCVNRELGILVDLKTVSCSAKEKFQLHSFDMKYHFQMADYLDGIRRVFPEVTRAVLIAIEREVPYSIGIFEVDADLLDLGLKLRDAAHDRYLEIENKKHSEGYSRQGENHIETLNAPWWLFEREMRLLDGQS